MICPRFDQLCLKREDFFLCSATFGGAEIGFGGSHLSRSLGSLAPRDIVAKAKEPDRFMAGLSMFDALVGISEMRRGELENCVMHPNASRCIFPISGAGRHEMTSGAEGAMASA